MLYEEGRKVTIYGERVAIKYPDAMGIKTGYTSDAGNCLVSGVNRDGLELISVVLKSVGMDQYSDTISLLEYGLHNFETVTYLKKGDAMFERPVEGSEQPNVNIVLAEDLTVTVNKHDAASYSVDGEVTAASTGGGLSAPIKAGEALGTAWVKSPDGQTIASTNLVAESDVPLKIESKEIADEGLGTLSIILRLVGLACLIAVVVVIIAVVRSAVKRRKRRRNRMYGAKLNNSVDPREVRRIKDIKWSDRQKR
jgi:D-alanyl-D-alanine carboxypeptidase (penicillin-binding protein 5/6)